MFLLPITPKLETTHFVTAQAEARSLSARLKARVELSPTLQKEMLFVESHGATPKTELEAFAASLHASVIPTKAGFEVDRTAIDEAKILKIRTSTRADWIKTRIQTIDDYRRPILAQSSPGLAIVTEFASVGFSSPTSYMGHSQFLRSQALGPAYLLPIEGFLEGLVSRIGVETIAAVPSGQTKVWETHPAGGTLPLPAANDLLADLTNQEANLSPQLSTPEAKSAFADSIDGFPFTSGLTRPRPAVDARLKVIANDGALVVEVSTFDKNGERVSQISLNARALPALMSAQDLLATADPTKPTIDVDVPALEALKQTEIVPRSPLPHWFLHPETDEPLDRSALLVQEALAKLHPGGCYIADVPDDLSGAGEYAINGAKFNLESYQKLVALRSPMEDVRLNGAFVQRPLDPEASESSRADRAVLGEYARQLTPEPKTAALDESRLYAKAANWAWTFNWSNPLGLVQGTWNFSTENRSSAMMSLVGHITESNWRRLEGGETLAASDLGLQDSLKALVDEDAVIAQTPDSKPGLFQHLNEHFKNDDLAQTRFKITNTRRKVMRMWLDGYPETVSWQDYNPEAIAHEGTVQSDFTSPVANVSTNQDAYEISAHAYLNRFAELNTPVFQIVLPDGATVPLEFIPTPENVSKPTPFGNLPEELKKQCYETARRFALLTDYRTMNGPNGFRAPEIAPIRY